MKSVLMQKIKVNNKTFKIRTTWSEINIDEWIELKKLKGFERAVFLSANKRNLYLLNNPEIIKAVEELTKHFNIESLDKMPLITTYIQRYKSYRLPEVGIINKQSLYLFYESAKTFCQAHEALMAAFKIDLGFIKNFCALYLSEEKSDKKVLTLSEKMCKLPMNIVLELIYHHMRFFSILSDPKQYPHLFSGKQDPNGNKVGGLGFVGFLHEWAMLKGGSINDITENVYDFFRHISYLRTLNKQK